jgi:hypothetical protein
VIRSGSGLGEKAIGDIASGRLFLPSDQSTKIVSLYKCSTAMISLWMMKDESSQMAAFSFRFI